jgi:hypothetical protein
MAFIPLITLKPISKASSTPPELAEKSPAPHSPAPAEPALSPLAKRLLRALGDDA